MTAPSIAVRPDPLTIPAICPSDAGTCPAGLRAGRGFFKIPERKLPNRRHQTEQSEICSVHRYDVATGVSRGSPAPAYRMLRGQKPSRRGCSTARNGGKVSDATFAAGSDHGEGEDARRACANRANLAVYRTRTKPTFSCATQQKTGANPASAQEVG